MHSSHRKSGAARDKDDSSHLEQFSARLAKQPQTHNALERQVSWCCFHHQLRVKIYKKQFFWQQGYFSLFLASTCSSSSSKTRTAFSHPPLMALFTPWWQCFVTLSLFVTPCSHMTEMSQGKSSCLVVCLCEETLHQKKPKSLKVVGKMSDHPEWPQNTGVSEVWSRKCLIAENPRLNCRKS